MNIRLSPRGADRPHIAWLLAGLFALALALRLWGVGFGLPHDLTGDEPHHIIQALRIGAGEGGPLVRMWHTVGKSGLDYILFAEYALLYVAWWATGRVEGPQDFALQYLLDPSAFYLAGRVTVAVLGAATCLIVFGIGRRLYGPAVGVGAALLAAVSYLHAAESHIINVHVPMTFALAAAVLAFVVYETDGRVRWLVAAGALCGAAVALAYTAALGLLVLVAGLATRASRDPRRLMRDAAIVGVSSLALVALMSPDLLANGHQLVRNFTQPTAAAATIDSPADQLRSAIDSVTILRRPTALPYIQILLKPYNLALTLAAIAGALFGLWKRERWTLILAGAAGLFVAILSLSSRGASELYLFAACPAMWLVGSRGLAELLRAGRPAHAVALLAAAAVPLTFVVRDDMMLQQPDTRIVAKQWIEAHVPSGAKILMDGMRFRFVQSPPLNPDRETVARRASSLEASELTVSGEMVGLYRAAAERIAEPRYNLHSTMYGLEVEDLDHYVRAGFDYVVISSSHEKRYEDEAERRRYPNSARFYSQIKSDPRFRAVYHVEPIPWKRNGPALTVYEVVDDGNHEDSTDGGHRL